MSYRFRTVFGVIASLSTYTPSLAQSSGNPNSYEVGRQFSAGANRVGQGANQIGDGFKQGALLTWHALQNGANAIGDSFTK